jgi:hypothetical protein
MFNNNIFQKIFELQSAHIPGVIKNELQHNVYTKIKSFFACTTATFIDKILYIGFSKKNHLHHEPELPMTAFDYGRKDDCLFSGSI